MFPLARAYNDRGVRDVARPLNFTAKTLLEKTFTKNVKGYDPLEVDGTLDKVIEDYRHYEKFSAEARPYIIRLESDVTKLKNAVQERDVEIARLKNRLSGIKDDPQVSRGNINLLKRIDALEKALYRKGVNPNSIK